MGQAVVYFICIKEQGFVGCVFLCLRVGG